VEKEKGAQKTKTVHGRAVKRGAFYPANWRGNEIVFPRTFGGKGEQKTKPFHGSAVKRTKKGQNAKGAQKRAERNQNHHKKQNRSRFAGRKKGKNKRGAKNRTQKKLQNHH
jgi:hypothetical protein